MASSQSTESFEDQMRRMIISNGPPTDRATHQPPTVRLPPQGAHMVNSAVQSQQRMRQPPVSQSLNAPLPQDAYAQRTTTNWRSRQDNSYAQNNGQYRRRQMQNPAMIDVNAFNRGQRPSRAYVQQGSGQLYHAGSFVSPALQNERKAKYLASTVESTLPMVEMSREERHEKEAFRIKLEQVCHELCEANAGHIPSVDLHCFGSFESGFASAGSDMDLAIVRRDEVASTVPFSLLEDDLPRQLEYRLLQLGYGARLLTRTRVPIIKICELPTVPLLSQLRRERQKWDALPFEGKYPHLVDNEPGERAEASLAIDNENDETSVEDAATADTTEAPTVPSAEQIDSTVDELGEVKEESTNEWRVESTGEVQMDEKPAPSRQNKAWTRERNAGPLDFPKDGVGIQCDINFFNPLGLHNTHMLRCYSLCDPRVRPMILFVKAWAKKRKVNSAYSGTLSSYGYVLMVLHYLMNVTRPPVLPNLQAAWRPAAKYTPQGADRTQVDEWVVDFWCRESEIAEAAASGQLTTNRETLGQLLAGFFRYYAAQAGSYSFHWMQQVLSLRTLGGVVTKEAKGWVKARTEEGEGKKVQYRYLFCIEDPFEHTHNVARTVTHHGIVAIRDEFRRANRILLDIGWDRRPVDGNLFDAIMESPQGEAVDPAGKQIRTSPNQPSTKPLSKPASLNTEDNSAFPALGPVAKALPKHTAPQKTKRESKQTNKAEYETASTKPEDDSTTEKGPRRRGRHHRGQREKVVLE